MHFDLGRAADRARARGADVRHRGGAARRPQHGQRLRRDDAAGRVDDLARAPRRARATTPTRSARRSTSWPGCCAATSCCWARASTRSRTTRTAASRAPGSASWPTRSAPRTPRRCRLKELPEALAQPRDRRRAADRRQGQRARAGPPARADGLRRRPPRHGRRRARRRGAPARPVHDQGLPGGRVRDPGPAPQAAARARGRGPDRGLARLQGRGRAVRRVPEGRAVRRAGRRPAPRGRRAARAGGHRPRAAARPPRRRRPQRLVHPRAPARALPRHCSSSACASCSSAASALATSRPSTCSARATRVRVHFLVHAPALPEVDERRARARGRPARPHVGRRAARRAGRALRRRSRAAAVVDLGRHAARPLQGLHGAADRRDGHRAARAAGRDRAVPRLAAAARGSHPRRALQARPEDRAGRRAADARGPRAARDRGDLDPADGRRRDVGAGVPRARARTAGRSTSRRWASASRSCWPPSTAATPRPTTSTGWSSPPGSTAARWRSCARTASTASGSARASPRATRTTCWSRTPRSRPSSCATSSCASTRSWRTTSRPRTRCATRSCATSTRSPRSTTTGSCATSCR